MHPLATNARSSASQRRRRRHTAAAPGGGALSAAAVSPAPFRLDMRRLVNLCLGADDPNDPAAPPSPPAGGDGAPPGGGGAGGGGADAPANPQKDELVIIAEPCRDGASAAAVSRLTQARELLRETLAVMKASPG